MPYRIVYTPAVRQQIAGLPGHVKAIARQRIAALSGNPRPPRSKELTGHPTGNDFSAIGVKALAGISRKNRLKPRFQCTRLISAQYIACG